MKLDGPLSEAPFDPSWWAPLDVVARLVQGNRRYRFFDVNDFMIMCRVVRSPRPSIFLYKHYYTRRYLNLDDEEGRAYRYSPPKCDRGDGRYVAQRDLGSALDHLELWELPWMKSELEEHQGGLSWEERWRLHPDFEEQGCLPKGEGRGHLYVV